ncbi:DUF803-domain-containing protein [Thelephora ganbajun]|uniref:DUF803-domain-containing protein n=2 Tax=Thelephora ganbajun TaxID=370292 RepID=A0ACB6YYG3_THEGA|nr:DUF803-domain-containing protein [Thelephora ganbajun]KAF9644564.1 DUF803-domain-containing protein [Thelephora ganbajun]
MALEILARSTASSNASLKIVGIVLAIVSGFLIGSSFVFKKKGLLRSQAGGPAGEGVAYLKSVLWWFGMILMILGEICNFAAYAFIEAIVVTPLGALSVVISAILSSIFLKEKLTFFGWLGCALCVIGSIIIALNGPTEESVGQIREFQKLFLSVGFVVFGSVMIIASVVIAIFVAPRWGKQTMIWYILICSMIGGLSVSVTTGLGSAIVTSVKGDNQFKYWFTYFLLGFVAITLLTEIYYLNVALALFNTAMGEFLFTSLSLDGWLNYYEVTPTYYVIFTFCTIVSTIVLFQGLHAPVKQIITLVMGFLVICLGITILQLSKVDPNEFKGLDRKSTILLQATRAKTEGVGEDSEKGLVAMEDPGVDSIRGSFGTVGSIIRARTVRKMSMSSSRERSADAELRARISRGHRSDADSIDVTPRSAVDPQASHFGGLKRHQLYDAPVPSSASTLDPPEPLGQISPSKRQQTIKFGDRDVVHSYARVGVDDDRSAIHEYRDSNVPLPNVSPFIPEDPFASINRLPAVAGLPLDLSPPRGFNSVDSPPTEHRKVGSSSQHVKSPSAKNYPKGNDGDDEDESESLWHRVGHQSDEESEIGLEESQKGIRLVTKPRT